MRLATTFRALASIESLAVVRPRLPVLAFLFLACFLVVVGISLAAARGKLHIPGYVGVAFLAFATALLVGRLAGIRGVTGTTLGFVLSVAFFLLIAASMGSVLALFFYRHPPET